MALMTFNAFPPGDYLLDVSFDGGLVVTDHPWTVAVPESSFSSYGEGNTLYLEDAAEQLEYGPEFAPFDGIYPLVPSSYAAAPGFLDPSHAPYVFDRTARLPPVAGTREYLILYEWLDAGGAPIPNASTPVAPIPGVGSVDIYGRYTDVADWTLLGSAPNVLTFGEIIQRKYLYLPGGGGTPNQQPRVTLNAAPTPENVLIGTSILRATGTAGNAATWPAGWVEVYEAYTQPGGNDFPISIAAKVADGTETGPIGPDWTFANNRQSLLIEEMLTDGAAVNLLPVVVDTAPDADGVLTVSGDPATTNTVAVYLDAMIRTRNMLGEKGWDIISSGWRESQLDEGVSESSTSPFLQTWVRVFDLGAPFTVAVENGPPDESSNATYSPTEPAVLVGLMIERV